MKKITLFLIFSISTLFAVAQLNQAKIDQFKWDDPTTFKFNPPLITGYGEYSDSLAKVYEGNTFFICDNEYYAITTFADYYYWFVKEYWWKFTDPQLYEYYYHSKNNLEMMKYIYGDKYKGKYYPLNIAVEIEGRNEYITKRMKENRYYADNDLRVNDFKKDLNSGKRERVEPTSNKVSSTNTYPTVRNIKRDKTTTEKVRSVSNSNNKKSTKPKKVIKK